MRQIAEFISVLTCALFTGAAVYISFIEHPARMQCGVEIAAAEFVPSYRRARRNAGDVGGFGFAVICGSVARRGDGLVVGCRNRTGQCHPVHADRDPAHQQAVAQPSIGSAVNRSRTPAGTLGQAARRAERAQRIGVVVVPVLGDYCRTFLRI
jgi:hypothetical protein